MIPRFVLSLVLLAVLPAGGTVIRTLCAAGEKVEIGTTKCAVLFVSEFGEADADAAAGEEIPRPPYVYRAFVAAGTSAAGGGSAASASLTAVFTTSGTSRGGWLDVFSFHDHDFVGTGSSRDGGTTIGPYSSGLWAPPNGRLAFTLGEPFPFEMWVRTSTGDTDYGFVYSSTWLQFALYESDGVTPVVPTQVGVPEPAWLGAGGVLLLIAGRLLRGRRSRS